MPWAIGVDIGGTFTDCVGIDPELFGRTPQQPGQQPPVLGPGHAVAVLPTGQQRLEARFTGDWDTARMAQHAEEVRLIRP